MPRKTLLPIASACLFAYAFPATAQLVVDERQLWDMRLFELESLQEKDRPLQFRVYGGYRYDSNLFRLSDSEDAQSAIGSSDKSDNIYQLGAGARLEMQKSRQRFSVDGEVEQNWFQNFGTLDHSSNRLRGAWDWEAGNHWNGTIGLGHRRYLESFTNTQQNVRDMIDRNAISGSANYRPVSYLRFSADLDWVDSDHDADTRQRLDNKLSSAAFTASWVTPAENAIGVQFRTTDARYPNAFDNDYDEKEYSVVATWRASAASVFRGRFGRTEREFEQGSDQNFDGPTWRLGYEWSPTDKTALEVAVWRELYGFEDLTDNYVRSTGFGLFPAWSVTPKLVLQGRAMYQQRDYFGNVAFVTASGQREDKDRMLQVAAIWSPLRLTKLVFAVERGDRDSNVAFADFDYYMVSVGILRTF